MAATAVQHIGLCQLNPFVTRDQPYDYNGHNNNPWLAPMPPKPFPPDDLSQLFGALLDSEATNEQTKIIRNLTDTFDPRSGNPAVMGTRFRMPGMGGSAPGGGAGGGGGPGGGGDGPGGGGGGPGGGGAPGGAPGGGGGGSGGGGGGSGRGSNIGPDGYGGPGGGLGGQRYDEFDAGEGGSRLPSGPVISDDPRRHSSTWAGVNLDPRVANAVSPELRAGSNAPLPDSPGSTPGPSSSRRASPGLRAGSNVPLPDQRAHEAAFRAEAAFDDMANANAHAQAGVAGQGLSHQEYQSAMRHMMNLIRPEEVVGAAGQGLDPRPSQPQLGRRNGPNGPLSGSAWKIVAGKALDLGAQHKARANAAEQALARFTAEPQMGRNRSVHDYAAGMQQREATRSDAAAAGAGPSSSYAERVRKGKAPANTVAGAAAAAPASRAGPASGLTRGAGRDREATTTAPEAAAAFRTASAVPLPADEEWVTVPGRTPRRPAMPAVNQRNEVRPRRARRTEAQLLQEYTATSNNLGKRATVAKNRGGR